MAESTLEKFTDEQLFKFKHQIDEAAKQRKDSPEGRAAYRRKVQRMTDSEFAAHKANLAGGGDGS